MKEKMLLKKICSIYASDLHFATMIFPFIHRELRDNTTVRTILEKDEQKNIEKILENIGLNSQVKDEVRKIDWNSTNINKIRETFKFLERDTTKNLKVDIIVSGSNIFIQKVNKAIDLWVKNNISVLERRNQILNIVNCFSFEENKEIDTIINSHEYILKTAGIEDILENELLKAN